MFPRAYRRIASPAPGWVRALFFSVVLLFPIIDLMLAYLYHLAHMQEVIWIRYYRDVACLLLAGMGFFSPDLPFQLRLSSAMYMVMLGVYTLASLIVGDLPASVVVSSLGTLLIPVSLTLAGFAAIRTATDMARLIRILMGYAVLSALFGVWEIWHTEFWTEVIGLGSYIFDVKGIPTGFQPDVFLPWNFVGFNGIRRAAGLLAAPLAQGFFLAVVGAVGFAYLRGRSLVLAGFLLALCFYGVTLSATRSAIVAIMVAQLCYFLYPTAVKKVRRANLILVVLAALIAFPLVINHFIYTVTLADSSTVGHLDALDKNLEDLPQVALVGSGVGASGPETSLVGLEIEGGGEGAIFSIAYQIGVPGALIFLWYFMRLFAETFARRHRENTTGELARALAFLFIGVALSMFSSEHILTFSGMGAFWFLVGGYLGYVRRIETVHAPYSAASTPHPFRRDHVISA